jgi:PAS domain S-box-containing protein
MTRPTRILFLEDNSADAELVKRELTQLGMKYVFKHVVDESGFRKALKEFVPDLILSDYNLPQFNGIEALGIAKEQAAHVPFIIVTGSINEETAVNCIKAGATDYVLKAHLSRLVISVKEALKLKKFQEEKRETENELEKYRNHLEEQVEKRTYELKQSEERFKAIAKTAHDAIVMMDNKGIISFWNQAAKKMFGYSNMEALGKELHLIIAPKKYYASYQKGMKDFQREGKGPVLGKTLELVAVRKNKKEFPIELSISALEIAGKHHAVGIIRDITERKKLQEELIRKDRLASLGQLAGGVAHELRNPLGTIKNAAYFLNMSLKKPGKNTKEMLKIMEEEITTASDTIDTLLDFASSDVQTKIEVDVNNVVQKALSRINIPGNIEVITQLDRTVPVILADPNQIERSFGNIALNAIQAMPKGGRLTIKSKSVNSKQILVSFKDNGIGIRKNDMGMLFEPLFTSKAKGIGLGLALTRLFIHRNGGIIEVQSKKNTGSTFSIKMPVIKKK